MIIIIALLVLVVIGLFFGFVGSREVSFGLEINRLNTPFFKIGIYSDRYVLEDGSYEDEVAICLFFIHITFIFWKPLD